MLRYKNTHSEEPYRIDGSIEKRLVIKFVGLKIDKNVNDIDVYVAEDEPFNPDEAVNEDSVEVCKPGKIFNMGDEWVNTLNKVLGAKCNVWYVNSPEHN
ncbi:hypothetical protein INT47_009330 [Mucor saturninus]|uniref:Uncharacterized protein n=1 Tax=Mucor saturninus TaxID=64648 RepID=A0A8H7QR98_9FUNG|nr:hypothetical protein INT47_009330 [Mucor saturninus]